MRSHQPINPGTHLKNNALFSELDDQEIALIARETRELRYERGEPIFHQGDACTGFHIVVFGQVKLSFISAGGAEKIVDVVEQGQSLGEAMMFLDKPYVVSAQALSDSLLLHVSKSAILGGIERDHGTLRKMLSSLAQRTYRLMMDVEGYTLRTGKQRIVGYLLEQLEREDQGQEPRSVDLAVSKYVIASRLNLTQEHFSRLLHELSDIELIKIDGRRLTIPCLQRLREFQFK